MNSLLDKTFFDGFAATNQETLEGLYKALQAGTGVDAGSFTGGRALIPESLDQTLVNILFSQDEARLFQRLKKQPVKSPVHQWDQRTGVGSDDGAWVPEAGDAVESDQDIARKYITMKYLQTLRKVSLQASISNMIEDAIALEKNAGTLWLIRNVEKALFKGDSASFPQQPDGLDALIPASNVIDLRGADATSDTFEDAVVEATRIIRNNYGKGSLLLASTYVTADIQKLLRDRMRVPAGENNFGQAIFKNYVTPFGTPEVLDDIFVTEGGAPSASALTSQSPGALSAPTATHPSDSSSKVTAAEAGTYYYKLVPVNRYGEGAAVASNPASLTLAAGEIARFAVADTSPAETAYRIYRSKKGASSAADVRYVKTVARSGASQNVDDTFDDMAGTSSVYILTMDTIYDAIEWVQFLPMMKFDLYPTTSAVYPFLMLLFGALALKKPVQHVRIKNVSPNALGWY
jgi:hypothetical protein